MCTATYDDANLILRLYDMRREPRLREARAWFGANFKAKTREEFIKLCPIGSEENASYRMVTSYWEMVASFVTAGVLSQELYFQSGREIVFIWERVRDLVPAQREMNKDPTLLRNMETVCKAYIEWMNKQSPDMYPTFSARVRG
jgi:hypothetical protein